MDQCQHCELKGNMEVCESTECGKHELWIVREYRKRIKDLEAGLKAIAELPYKREDWMVEGLNLSEGMFRVQGQHDASKIAEAVMNPKIEEIGRKVDAL